MKTTMKEIRAEYAKRIRFAENFGLDLMVPYHKGERDTIERLWKDGYTKEYSSEFLALANGYKITTGDPDFHVTNCLDLHLIESSKASTKRLAAFILKIGEFEAAA